LSKIFNNGLFDDLNILELLYIDGMPNLPDTRMNKLEVGALAGPWDTVTDL
jgi:hypothetical protein